MSLPKRNFGVEIECVNLTQEQSLLLLRKAGFKSVIGEREDSLKTTWKITTDISVTYEKENIGVEIVSPILKGVGGLKKVSQVADILMRGGAEINTTCGLHVHVDAMGLTSVDLANVVNRYARFENLIDSFMPYSRRLDNNMACESVKGIAKKRLTPALRKSRTTRSFVSNAYYMRGYKINLLSYLKYGTIEFRQHSGTIDPVKIRNWIWFCLNFVEQSKIAASQKKDTINHLTNFEKGILTELKIGPKRTQDLIRTIGYKSIPTVVSTLRRKGWLIANKDGYYCLNSKRKVSKLSEKTLPKILSKDTCFRGLPKDIISFYKERMIELS